MSEQSWLDEFYSIPSTELPKDKPASFYISHSLLKWTGALKKNLKKHKLKEPPIYFNADTCSLCYIYRDSIGFDDCSNCPLFLSRGGVSCVRTTSKESSSPYHKFLDFSNPRPMISSLRQCLRWQENQDLKKAKSK